MAGKIKSVLDVQHGGSHYKQKAIQPIEYAHANNLSFFQGNVVKYVTRYKDKKGKEDIEKAIHYLQMILEFEYGVKSSFEKEVDAEEELAPSVFRSNEDDGWIPWTGGKCPVDPDTKVMVELRGVGRKDVRSASYWQWGWVSGESISEIIAYKIVKD